MAELLVDILRYFTDLEAAAAEPAPVDMLDLATAKVRCHRILEIKATVGQDYIHLSQVHQSLMQAAVVVEHGWVLRPHMQESGESVAAALVVILTPV
jgi:hypothetical protein